MLLWSQCWCSEPAKFISCRIQLPAIEPASFGAETVHFDSVQFISHKIVVSWMINRAYRIHPLVCRRFTINYHQFWSPVAVPFTAEIPYPIEKEKDRYLYSYTRQEKASCPWILSFHNFKPTNVLVTRSV